MTVKRNDVIQFRVSTREKREIQMRADTAGLSLSDWLRCKINLLTESTEREPMQPDQAIEDRYLAPLEPTI